MNDDNDAFWILIAIFAGVFLFGGTIIAWLTTQSQAAISWLLDKQILVSESQSVIGYGGVGLDLPRIILGALGFLLLLWLTSKVARMFLLPFIVRRR